MNWWQTATFSSVLSSTSSFPVLFSLFALVIGDKLDPHSYAASEM